MESGRPTETGRMGGREVMHECCEGTEQGREGRVWLGVRLGWKDRLYALWRGLVVKAYKEQCRHRGDWRGYTTRRIY